MRSAILLTVRLGCFCRDDDGFWVAGCPSLDVYSQGTSEEDARRSLREALELWFESCIERGVLHQALQELGFRPNSPGAARPQNQELLDLTREDEEQTLGQPFEAEIEIPAYQAELFQEPRVIA